MLGWMNTKPRYRRMNRQITASGISHASSLLTLSIDALVATTSAYVLQLLKRREGSPPSLEEASNICRQLNAFLRENLPRDLIDLVSTLLIKRMAVDAYKAERSPAVIIIYGLLLYAVLLHQRWEVLDELTLRSLWKKLCDCDFSDVTQFLLGLNTTGFSLSNECADWMLDVLVITCPDIRKLFITTSMKVTDASSSQLLHLQHLSKLYLMGSKIDVSRFINALSAHPVSRSLKIFTCSFINTSDVITLINSCPSLGHIGLEWYKRVGSFHIEEKHKIIGLTFWNCNYNDVRDIIMELGPSLCTLELKFMYNLLLMEVISLCPSLQVFGICRLINPFYSPPVQDDFLFENLHCLSLNIEGNFYFISHVVRCSKKLQTLTLMSNEENCFDSLLESCTLTNLEQLFVGTLSSCTALILLRRCPRLCVMSGVNTSDLSTFLTEAATINPKVLFYSALPRGKKMNVQFNGI